MEAKSVFWAQRQPEGSLSWLRQWVYTMGKGWGAHEMEDKKDGRQCTTCIASRLIYKIQLDENLEAVEDPCRSYGQRPVQVELHFLGTLCSHQPGRDLGRGKTYQ